MSSRIMWIELRRSTALALAVGGFVIGALIIYPLNDRQWWEGNWMTMTASQRSMTFVLLAGLATGAGAWHAGRDRGPVAELIASTSRVRRQRLLPSLVVLGVAAILAYLPVLALGAVAVAPLATYVNVSVVAAVAAVGALAMLAAAWLGFTAGQLLRSRFTTPLVTILMVAVLLVPPGFAPLLERSELILLIPAMEMSYRATLVFSHTASALQAFWLLALAAGAAIAVCATRGRSRLLAIVPVVAAVAVVVPQLPKGSDTAPAGYVVDPAAAAPVCAQGAPRVCVTRVNAAVLPQITEPAREALAQLACLPDPPIAAAQLSPTTDAFGSGLADVSGGTLWMPVPSLEPDGTLSPTDLDGFAATLVEGATTDDDGRRTTATCPLSAAPATGSRG
ncbi:MAG: hypothetical protein ACRCYR_20810 [Phycicoccus sp.]